MGVRALSTYSREEIEKLVMSLRSQIAEKDAELAALTIRSREVLMDTARCASLINGIRYIQASFEQDHCQKARQITEALMAEIE